MTDLQEQAMRMALEASCTCGQQQKEAKEALRTALAQPKQEPVAFVTVNDLVANFVLEPAGLNLSQKIPIPLYTAPPKREWSGLSVSKAEELIGEFENDPYEMLFALDKYLREKNT